MVDHLRGAHASQYGERRGSAQAYIHLVVPTTHGLLDAGFPLSVCFQQSGLFVVEKDALHDATAHFIIPLPIPRGGHPILNRWWLVHWVCIHVFGTIKSSIYCKRRPRGLFHGVKVHDSIGSILQTTGVGHLLPTTRHHRLHREICIFGDPARSIRNQVSL